METSYCADLNRKPDVNDLKTPLGSLFSAWMKIRDFVFDQYPKAVEEWFVSVKKFGWSFRIKDKRRAIVYLSPQTDHFHLTMVSGQKATVKILESDIKTSTKVELIASKVYMEGSCA